MKFYEEPMVMLLTLENEDVLTLSDPMMDDLDWVELP